MGFTIDGGGGILYAVFITVLITVGVFVLLAYIKAVKQSRDSVVEDEGDDLDLKA